RLTGFRPRNSYGGQAVHEFYVQAVMKDSTRHWIEGYSCFPVAGACGPEGGCTPVGPAVPVNCWEAYDDYHALSVSGLDDYAEFYLCAGQYGLCLEDYSTYLSTMGVSISSSPYHMSLSDSCRLEAGFYQHLYFHYLQT